jgi:hypothetical protein
MLKEKKRKKENQNLFESNVKFLSFYLKANTAAVSPPLSSVLGNLGLNTMKFCKEFNSFTEELVSYFLLKVFVKVDLNLKTWSFKLGSVPITFIFRLISFKTKLKFTGLGGFFFKEYYFITLYSFFLVIIFFNKNINKHIIKNYLSIIKSMDMLIIDKKVS